MEGPTRTRLGLISSSFVLAAIVLSLYGTIVRLWWTRDDFFCIHILQESHLSYWGSSEVWRQTGMFTPVLLLSFRADMIAAGLQPRFFYLHQLVAFSAAVVALFWLLRLWLPAGLAFVGSVLFLLGAPSFSWVEELLVRHYAEGLLLTILSAGLFVKSLREGRSSLSLFSAVLYLAAMLAKEVYASLICLLILIPEGDLRLRLRRLRPHMVAFAVFATWRYAALGRLAGGYGWTVRGEELPRLIVAFPGRLAATFLGDSQIWNGILIAVLIAGASAAVFSSRRALALFAVALVLGTLPFLPVSKAFQPRYGVLAWIACVVAFAFGCQRLLRAGSRRLQILAGVLVVLAITAAFVVNRSVWNLRFSAAERISAEEIFFLGMKDGELLRHPMVAPAAMKELRWYKEELLGYSRGAGWFADDLYLCDPSHTAARVWQYQEASRRVEDITAAVPAVRDLYCNGLREAPLEADFRYEKGDFFWNLGPYQTGSYAIVYGGGIERIEVAREDGYRRHSAVMTLKIRYESPEGWVTYSPDLPLDFRATGRIRWDRKSPTSPEGIR